MTISWYSISISPQRGGVGAIFNGYFSVDNNANLVTAFYETINGSTNFNNNILGPNPFPSPLDFYTAQNTYTNNNWGGDGTNISSITLQSAYNYGTPYFNIYGNNILWRNNDLTSNMLITQISDPPIYVTNDLQLYNFLNSDREQCIIINDINVNFNLTSSNGIKTILSDNLIKITKI